MHIAVIIPFHCRSDRGTLAWTLEGYVQQQLSPTHTLEIMVGIDGGQATPLELPQVTGLACRYVALPHAGSAAVRNALIRQTSSRAELLVFADADARPEPAMVQSHADTMAKLPAGSLVLGGVRRESSTTPCVFDVLMSETSALHPYPSPKAGTWQNWRAACMENLSMTRAQFVDSGGFPEALRPWGFEDFVLAHRLLGNESRVYYQPEAGVVQRRPSSLDDYLDQEEAMGTMAPILARVAPDTFQQLWGSTPVAALAQRYALWVQMDNSLHKAVYQQLSSWAPLPQERLGQEPGRSLALSALYQMHLPLKRLAYRLGFLRGLQLANDSQWEMRRPQRLWRQVLDRR